MSLRFYAITALLIFALRLSVTNVLANERASDEFWTIASGKLTARISRVGGELVSFTRESREYIWQGQPGIWPGHSPILFPIVGGLRDNTYTYKGRTYTMEKHGFARNMSFELRSIKANSLVIGITSSTHTKESYPFDFDFEVEYSLTEDALEVKFRVRNTSSSEPLYFSVGAHPAFNCPINPNERRNDYQLLFAPPGKPKTQNRNNGLLIDQTREVLESPGVLHLSDNLFEQNAIVFSPNPFTEASIIHKPSGITYVTVHFKGFPFLGIWSDYKVNQVPPFVCIEPWYGLNDFADHDQDLTRKRGIIYTSAGNYFETSYSIEINN